LQDFGGEGAPAFRGKLKRGHVRNSAVCARKRVSSDETLSVAPICNRCGSRSSEIDVGARLIQAAVERLRRSRRLEEIAAIISAVEHVITRSGEFKA
jgi:hypothetical protein